jgi:uncharacterized protein (DUF1499 family)
MPEILAKSWSNWAWLAVPAAAFLVFRCWPSRTPAGLGIHDGRLAECPAKPNCVCSQSASEEHHIEAFSFSGEPEPAFRQAIEAAKSLPGARLVEQGDGYARIECVTRIFGFVDDLELLLDPAQHVIHVRSASRVGYSDLGVNRARVESLRSKFEE